MKNLQLLEEGTWIELNQVEFTEAQIALLMSTNEEDKDSQKELKDEIESLSKSVAQEEDAALAQAKYEEVKPALKETDVYQLISFDTIINEGTLSGILNCRVNGEHKQIRF
jgi:hypothetical protein